MTRVRKERKERNLGKRRYYHFILLLNFTIIQALQKDMGKKGGKGSAKKKVFLP